MLSLAYSLDDKITIDDTEYTLDLSFDNVLRLFDMLEDNLLRDDTKLETGLLMLINDKLENHNIKEKEKIFYEIFIATVGEGRDIEDSLPKDIAGNPMPVNKEKEERNYSLKEDAEYIYASFMSDYGIDLIEQQGKLHWYKFKALLGGLTDDSKFVRVLEIRNMELPKGKGSQKQREQIKKLKAEYKLEGNN